MMISFRAQYEDRLLLIYMKHFFTSFDAKITCSTQLVMLIAIFSSNHGNKAPMEVTVMYI